MNKEWEYAGLLIDSFNIDVKRVLSDDRFGDNYPGQWIAYMEKKPINKPSFTISAWGASACEAVINVYNKSHHATPVNPYKDIQVFMTKDSGGRPYTLRHHCPNTRQHGKIFDSYHSKDNALTAVKHYGMELFNE
jgi:hypothetical protein